MKSVLRRNVLLLLAGAAPLATVLTCSPGRFGTRAIVFSGDDDDFDDFDDDFFDDDFEDDLEDFFDD